MPETVDVTVPPQRWERWCENFAARHGDASMGVEHGRLVGRASDGSWFSAAAPFDRVYDGPATVAGLLAASVPPADWGVLLVRKGGFAVARLAHGEIVASKVGRRHVQGRTKAGGQSQQRFARRRDNQAREAYEAATGHAVAVLGGEPLVVVTGGDHGAVAAVLAERRLDVTVVGPWLPVPDPRRSVLDAAIRDAGCMQVSVTNADPA